MISAVLLLALQTVDPDELPPGRFYVSGVQQGMTTAEYNALVANGRYKSEPFGVETFWARINSQDLFVTFCQGRVVRVITEYRSSDWLQSMKVLEEKGFRWGAPSTVYEANQLRTGSMMLATTAPKGYAYFVVPMIKTAMAQNRDMPSFQLMFEAVDNSCR